jgi:hypothetical protein
VAASWVRLACTASYPAVVIFPSRCSSSSLFAADFLEFLRQLVGCFAVDAAGLPLLLDHAE